MKNVIKGEIDILKNTIKTRTFKFWGASMATRLEHSSKKTTYIDQMHNYSGCQVSWYISKMEDFASLNQTVKHLWFQITDYSLNFSARFLRAHKINDLNNEKKGNSKFWIYSNSFSSIFLFDADTAFTEFKQLPLKRALFQPRTHRKHGH